MYDYAHIGTRYIVGYLDTDKTLCSITTTSELTVALVLLEEAQGMFPELDLAVFKVTVERRRKEH